MARLRAGDARAFSALYERHARRLYTFLARHSRDRHLAEDLLQETFLRVFTHRRAYRASGQFRAWLFTIARRLLIDHVRRERPVWDAPDVADQAPASGSPESHAEARESLERLEGALAALPSSLREVVLLSRLVGLRADEIAEVTGSTPGAVRVALHRALRRLRALVEGDDPTRD